MSKISAPPTKCRVGHHRPRLTQRHLIQTFHIRSDRCNREGKTMRCSKLGNKRLTQLWLIAEQVQALTRLGESGQSGQIIGTEGLAVVGQLPVIS